MQGVIFQMKVEIGQQLFDLLEGIADASWYWSIGQGESYYAGFESYFLETSSVMDGPTFIRHISSGPQYLIFVDIKAFPTLDSVVEINNYKEFMKSSCKLSLLVIDSDQVIVIAQDNHILASISERAKILGHKELKSLHDDELQGLLYSVWGE